MQSGSFFQIVNLWEPARVCSLYIYNIIVRAAIVTFRSARYISLILFLRISFTFPLSSTIIAIVVLMFLHLYIVSLDSLYRYSAIDE